MQPKKSRSSVTKAHKPSLKDSGVGKTYTQQNLLAAFDHARSIAPIARVQTVMKDVIEISDDDDDDEDKDDDPGNTGAMTTKHGIVDDRSGRLGIVNGVIQFITSNTPSRSPDLVLGTTSANILQYTSDHPKRLEIVNGVIRFVTSDSLSKSSDHMLEDTSTNIPRHALDHHVGAIICIGRVSDQHEKVGQRSLDGVKEKTRELAEFITKEHVKIHGSCICHHSMLVENEFIINGMSSNTNFNSTIRTTRAQSDHADIVRLRKYLHDLVEVQMVDLILFTISTTEGFLTNVFGFVAFFETYIEKLPGIRIVVCYNGNKYDVLTLQEIFRAVHNIINKDTLGATPADFVVEKMISIAYNKVRQKDGNMGTRLVQPQQRNVLSLGPGSYPEQRRDYDDPGLRVNRILRQGGTDFHPEYIQGEEVRVKVDLDSHGRFKCPEPGCRQVFPSLKAIAAHVMQRILEQSEVSRTCTLCPIRFDDWNFVSVIHGIYHILRHISRPHTPTRDGRCAQCPHCFAILYQIAEARDHIQRYHMQTFEITFAASKLGLCQPDKIWEHANDGSIAVQARRDLLELGPEFTVFTTQAALSRAKHVNQIPTGSPLPFIFPFNECVQMPDEADTEEIKDPDIWGNRASHLASVPLFRDGRG